MSRLDGERVDRDGFALVPASHLGDARRYDAVALKERNTLIRYLLNISRLRSRLSRLVRFYDANQP